MCPSPTDAAKQKLIMDTVFSVDLMDYKMHVQNTLFHHFYVCTYSFLFSASEPPCCWFNVISLTRTIRYIIHIYEKSMNFRSKKLRNTIFCVCSDKVNLPSFILEDNGSLPFTQNLSYFCFCTLTLPMLHIIFLSLFCTALLIFVHVIYQPHFSFAFLVLSSFVLSFRIIAAEL